ncbi:MAG: quinolinate synthase NadA [Planctomycetota bacterium]|nr:quinolinate synthase NadA [Planctomycetota bacterium]
MTSLERPAAAELAERIGCLRRERQAFIIAHNYQVPEVQDVADFVGDSLAMARAAARAEAETIVVCGVHFMAETAKLLNPGRTVLEPDPHAGCPMADMITPRELAEAKARHPDAAVVAYVNSSAAVKAASDICCTSANAVAVVESIPRERPVLFVPDGSLGEYVAGKTGRTNLILWPGFCPTHHRILPEHLEARRREYPDAEVLVHPECTRPVREMADFIGSTSQIIQRVESSPKKAFIIATELGVCHTLRRRCPAKTVIQVSRLADCPNMKLNTLEKVLWSLEDRVYPVTVPDDAAAAARRAIERMLAIP